MNRPVCCCSETCPVHCLVPSPAGESHPAHGQEGRGPGGLERERVGGGVLRPDHLPHSFWWLLSQRGGPSPACEVRTHLGDSGGGGRLGVLGWGPRSPPVLHILIHPIFGTRKGTNISVLNSFPSPPTAPHWFRCCCPVFHLWPLTATATPRGAGDAPAGLGLARVLVAHPGAHGLALSHR